MAPTPPRLLVLSALEGEVRPLLNQGQILTHCHHAPASLYELYLNGRFIRMGWTGMGPENAARFARYVAGEFPTSLAILTGYAGSTSMERMPGTLILSSEVLRQNAKPLAPDPAARKRAAAQVPLALGGALRTLTEIVTDGGQKTKFTDALAVEMETHAAAGALNEAGVPWISLRAVLDTPGHSLKGIGNFTNDDGSIRTGALIGSILRDPLLMGRLIKLGGAQGAARKSLLPALEQLVIEFA